MGHTRSNDLDLHGRGASAAALRRGLFSKGGRRFLFSVMMTALVVGGVVKIAAAQEASSAEEQALDRAARELFAAGMAAVEENRFSVAVQRFQRAYELSERPALLYNVGYAADRARQDEVALQAYREYVRLAPDGEYRGRAETRIGFISALLEEGEDTAPEVAEPVSIEVPVAHGPDPVDRVVVPADLAADATGAHWLVGAGAVVLAGAGVALAFGFMDQQAVENPRPDAPWDEVSEANERGPALLTAGFIAGAVGLSTIVAGIVWLAAGGDDDAPVTWTPWGVEGSF
ncbi:MAG: tol-pal system YbgF family protein [Sandaracinaceae bacterium]